MKKTKNYEDSLLEALKDNDEALAYLNAALMDEDQEVFLLALKHVLKAQNIDISDFAQRSEITCQNIYHMLSKKVIHGGIISVPLSMPWDYNLDLNKTQIIISLAQQFSLTLFSR